MGVQLEKFPEWPATMDRSTALAYSGVSEATLAEFEKRGIIRFLAQGPRRKMITPRAGLDRMIEALWATGGALPASEDFDFGDD